MSRAAIFALTVCLGLVSCAPKDRMGDLAELPCEVPAQSVNLGRPRTSGEPAEVTYNGQGQVYGSLATLEPSEIIIKSKGDFTSFYFGSTAEAPEYDERNGDIDNAFDASPGEVGLSMYVYYHGFVEVPLPKADRYWMFTSNINELELFTCDPGVLSDAVAVAGRVGVQGYTQVPVEIRSGTSE